MQGFSLRNLKLQASRVVKLFAGSLALMLALSGTALSATAHAAIQASTPVVVFDFAGSELQVDYRAPQPEARWRIIENKLPTNYWVNISLSNPYWSGVDAAYTCDFFLQSGGKLLRKDDTSVPYSCSLSAEGPGMLSAHLVPVVWSSVAGSLSAEGSVGLDQGQQTSRNARFFVSDSLHKPTDPVANINPGQTTSWSAEMRNGEGATADDGARTDFSYRILDDGEPTKYYAKGFMQNVKSLAGYKYTYECHIYFHDPDHGGTETEYSPYTCDYDATESGYSDSHLAAYFNVKAR